LHLTPETLGVQGEGKGRRVITRRYYHRVRTRRSRGSHHGLDVERVGSRRYGKVIIFRSKHFKADTTHSKWCGRIERDIRGFGDGGTSRGTLLLRMALVSALIILIDLTLPGLDWMPREPTAQLLIFAITSYVP
jgi:hypothetical protein